MERFIAFLKKAFINFIVLLPIFNSLTLAWFFNFFSEFAYRTIIFIGMALLNAISLLMFQNKFKISPTVLPINLTEHIQIFKKMFYICMKNASVTIIKRTSVVLDSAKWIVPKSIYLNRVSFMKLARAVSFMKPCVGLTFFVLGNSLRFLLSIHKSCYIKYTINPIENSNENHNNK